MSSGPCALSLVVDSAKAIARAEPARQTTTLPQFAGLLDQPVTTLKRLFTAGILPENLIKRTPGKHWRVSFSDEELRICKASLVFWSVWRRKPRASKTYARRDELSSTVIQLILAKPRSGDDRDLKSPRAKIEAFFRALRLLNRKRKNVEAVWWKERILANPTKLAVAAFALRTAVAKFQRKYGRKPTRRQLADALEISERSIYRSPFGKDALEVAFSERNLAGAKRNLAGARDEEKAEVTDDPMQKEYRRIEKSDYGKQHQPQIFDRIGEDTRRKLRKQKVNLFEIEWEKDPVGKTAAALLIFESIKLQAKRRLEMIEQQHGGLKRNIKRLTRQSRDDVFLQEKDETFGSLAIGAYEEQPDGKFHWWMNCSTREGCADSILQARREILVSVKLAKIKLRIQNLDEALAHVGL